MEIEKRYTPNGNIPYDLASKKEYIEQGYSVLSDGKKTPDVRIRKLVCNDETTYFQTVKYPTDSKYSRIEIESTISEDEYNKISKLLTTEIVKKYRYYIPINENLVAQIDEYIDKKRTIIEVEFNSEDAMSNFEKNKPSWIGKDVTGEINFVKIKINNSFTLCI